MVVVPLGSRVGVLSLIVRRGLILRVLPRGSVIRRCILGVGGRRVGIALLMRRSIPLGILARSTMRI
jgi:hypothetical protein